MFYWIMAIITLLLLVLHMLQKENWEWFKESFGESLGTFAAIGVLIAGTIVWPAGLIFLAVRTVLKAKS